MVELTAQRIVIRAERARVVRRRSGRLLLGKPEATEHVVQRRGGRTDGLGPLFAHRLCSGVRSLGLGGLLPAQQESLGAHAHAISRGNPDG